jgi:hypothetical protein
LPIHLTPWIKRFWKIVLFFRKNTLNDDGMMIIEHSKYQVRPYG